MICSLVLEDVWLVLAFNGGGVQFWALPETHCISSVLLDTNISDADFDLVGLRFCASLADRSIVVYDCSSALVQSHGACRSLPSLPIVARYDEFQSTPQHVAFWNGGIATATSRRFLVFDADMRLAYSAHDCIFWDLKPEVIVVHCREGEVDVCTWSPTGINSVSCLDLVVVCWSVGHTRSGSS